MQIVSFLHGNFLQVTFEHANRSSETSAKTLEFCLINSLEYCVSTDVIYFICSWDWSKFSPFLESPER